jgi:hypothetical protein
MDRDLNASINLENYGKKKLFPQFVEENKDARREAAAVSHEFQGTADACS